VDRAESPWDGPAHFDKRRVFPAEEIRTVMRLGFTEEEIQAVAERLTQPGRLKVADRRHRQHQTLDKRGWPERTSRSPGPRPPRRERPVPGDRRRRGRSAPVEIPDPNCAPPVLQVGLSRLDSMIADPAAPLPARVGAPHIVSVAGEPGPAGPDDERYSGREDLDSRLSPPGADSAKPSVEELKRAIDRLH
jgi:hypothetical protein